MNFCFLFYEVYKVMCRVQLFKQYNLDFILMILIDLIVLIEILRFLGGYNYFDYIKDRFSFLGIDQGNGIYLCKFF